jgi:hypothetical protein
MSKSEFDLFVLKYAEALKQGISDIGLGQGFNLLGHEISNLMFASRNSKA